MQKPARRQHRGWRLLRLYGYSLVGGLALTALIETIRQVVCATSFSTLSLTAFSAVGWTGLAVVLFARNRPVQLLPASRETAAASHVSEAPPLPSNSPTIAVQADGWAELAELKQFTDNVLDRLPSAVLAFGVDGRVRVFNAAARRLLASVGLDPHRLQHRSLPVWIRLNHRFSVFEYSLQYGAELYDHSLAVKVAGEPRVFEVHVTPVESADGAVVAALGTAREVTATRRLQQQLLDAERLAAVGRWAAGAAHEIRNPLTAIKGFVELMLEESPDGSDVANLWLIGEEIARIERLIDGMLLMSRPPSPDSEPCNLNEIVQKAVALVCTAAGRQGIGVKAALATDLPPLYADSDQLQQVLLNLAYNAIEAMPEGGILQFETGVIGAGAHRHIILRVTDSGAGIPEQFRHQIFDPFFTTKSTGTGLGLAVVHGIVRNHRGRIEVDSTPDHGTTVTVLLPVRR